MPRAVALNVKSATKSTRWTLGQDHTPTESPRATDSMMQANGNGGYFDHQRSPPLPRYSDYDGSHYGTSHYDGSHDSMESGRRSDLGWNLKQPESLSVGEFDAFDFHQTPMNDLGFYDNKQALVGMLTAPRDEDGLALSPDVAGPLADEIVSIYTARSGAFVAKNRAGCVTVLQGLHGGALLGPIFALLAPYMAPPQA